MRLRWTLTLAFVALAVLQVAIVVPLALRNLSELLTQQQQTRIDQVMVSVTAERQRLQADVRRAMDELAQSTALEEVARDAARVPPSPKVTRAATELMTPRGLEVLALLDDEGRTLSSGHLPARLGEPDDPLFVVTRSPNRATVVLRVDLTGPTGLVQAPAVVTARPVDYGDRRVWAVGGVLLNEARARELAKLSGARAEFLSEGSVIASAGDVQPPTTTRELLLGDAATLRFTFSLADAEATRTEVLLAFLLLAALGLFFSVALGFALSRRVTRPVEALTEAAGRIASGEPGVRVELNSSGELRALVDTFNRMTSDLKTATDQLVASERIAAWQEVARRLAHEIKNPLTPIRMSLETLLAASSRGQLDERFQALFRESAGAVLEEVDRLKRIVDEFSQFARLPKPKLEPMSLSDAAQQVMALYAAHGGTTYVTQIAPGVQVLGDRDQLTQVLVNLVKNAEEAMEPQGGGQVTVRVLVRDDKALVEVEDAGPGLSAELKARIFEPYVTTKPNGTGLGLAIASRICTEHNGALSVGDGTSGAIFTVALPLVA